MEQIDLTNSPISVKDLTGISKSQVTSTHPLATLYILWLTQVMFSFTDTLNLSISPGEDKNQPTLDMQQSFFNINSCCLGV